MLISLQNASILIDKTLILTDISLQIGAAEWVYLIGKTGSGKSSFLRTLYADLPLGAGEMNVLGYSLHKLAPDQIPFLRRKMGFVFQDFQLFSDRSIAQNLDFVLQATGWTDSQKRKNKVLEVLERTQMVTSKAKLPHQLSGGEQQRIAVARSLLNNPQIILADEPSANLDPQAADQMIDLFWQIHSQGTTIIMATHQHDFLRKRPARVLWCENHRISDWSKEEIIRKML